MSGAWNQPEELRCRIDEIDDLGYKQKQERLAEVSQNAHNRKYHACEIAICVTDKDFRWVPIMVPESRGHP